MAETNKQKQGWAKNKTEKNTRGEKQKSRLKYTQG